MNLKGVLINRNFVPSSL